MGMLETVLAENLELIQKINRQQRQMDEFDDMITYLTTNQMSDTKHAILAMAPHTARKLVQTQSSLQDLVIRIQEHWVDFEDIQKSDEFVHAIEILTFPVKISKAEMDHSAEL